MKLGEILLRDGRLTETQLEAALAQQGREGGRLGTVLFERGLIDLDALTVYLGLEHATPIATGAMLERAKTAAVRLLSPEQAYHFKCVPLVVQDRQLIAAVEDPLDYDTLDAIGRVSGYRVLPRIAPEVRIYYYVERFYGVRRPARFAVFGDQPRGDVAPIAGLPARPLPGLPPVVEHPEPIPAAAPPPAVRRRRATSQFPFDAGALSGPVRAAPAPPPAADAPRPVAGGAPDDDPHAAVEIEAEDLIIEMEADAQAEAGPAPLSASAPPSRSASGPVPAVHFPPLSLPEALARMEQAAERGEVAAALMGFAGALFDVAALFIVRDHLALGWKSAGAAGSERIDCALVPLDAPSMFQQALHHDARTFHGAPSPSTLHHYVYKVLRSPMPARATVAVVAIGARPVNLLYGHRAARDELTDDELAGLGEVRAAAAAAYVRLIASAKGR